MVLNPNDCTCGTSTCTKATGLVCQESDNECSELNCTITDGSATNPSPCLCGTSACTADTGLVCQESINECSELMVNCIITDGSAHNPSPCVCGTTPCTEATGFVCDVNNVGSKCKNYAGQYDLNDFIKITSGTCAEVNGNGTNLVKNILDQELCGIAGMFLGSGDGTAYLSGSYDLATGCSLDYSYNRQGTRLNLQGTSKTCSNSDNANCLCLVAPLCAFTNGLRLNNGPCFCGSTHTIANGVTAVTTCTSTVGYYCVAARNTCCSAGNGCPLVELPQCMVTNGTAMNDASCTCGSVVCTSTTGLICFSTVGGGTCRKRDLGTFGYELVERYIVV